MRFLILALFLCFSFKNMAQQYFLSAPKNSWTLETYGTSYLGTNSITNSFTKKIFTGNGFIDDNIKNDVFKKLKTTKNTLGFESELGLLWKKKQEKYNYLLGFRNVDLFNARFNKATFQLLFLGNEPFRGQTLSLAPFDFTNITYQCLDIGIGKEQKNHEWFGFFSFSRGLQYQRSQMTKGTLYTAEDGTSIEFSSDVFFTQNPDISNKFTPINGLGLAVSGGYSQFLNAEKTHRIDVLVRDLGWIRYKNLYHYDAKDDYNFEGVEINDILNIQNEFSSLGKNEDGKSELDNLLGLEESRKKVDYVLPSLLKINYQYPINEKLKTSASIQHYVNMYPIPRLNAQLDYSIGKNTQISPLIMYGAWGKLNTGFQYQQRIKEHYFVKIQTYFFEYLFAPKITTSNAINLQLWYVFNK